ncbi:hypothetical protein AX17_001711 [Amanita inopinata Kibby_2008]|nr:hypothetical protein AX17_001711 [Amanita inopinata Kibby_2008]
MATRVYTRAESYDMTVKPTKTNRVPPPPYRHAAPSAPWPWIDIGDGVDKELLKKEAPPVPADCDHKSCDGDCWGLYPQSRFPNWTENQVRKSKIFDAIWDYDSKKKCKIYQLDVDKCGLFHGREALSMNDDDLDLQWEQFKDTKQPDGVRVRALFIENMSGPVLRMLGAKYNIEPFFFSSSLNWIPSNFQEDPRSGVGDHITITLPFIQSLPETSLPHGSVSTHTFSNTLYSSEHDLASQMIDTQSPLRLSSSRKALVLDLLSVHLVRNVGGNTIISYHANMDLPTTKAEYLYERIHFAGQSVYWQKMLGNAVDPTFLLLIFVWHAMYAWDEALQDLYEHICVLETEVIGTSSMNLTQELHVIRAHHLHYSSLLSAFKKAVDFISRTSNPALTHEESKYCRHLLVRECATLTHEIERMDTERTMQERRLRNVMNLVFSSVNIHDSKSMQQMTQAAVRDSAAVSIYIHSEFEPLLRADEDETNCLSHDGLSSLTSITLKGIFGMNVKEVNPGTNGTLPHYFGAAIALTVATIWIIIAFQSRYLFNKDAPFWKRLGWPFFLIRYMLLRGSEDSGKLPVESGRHGALPMFGGREYVGVLRQCLRLTDWISVSRDSHGLALTWA